MLSIEHPERYWTNWGSSQGESYKVRPLTSFISRLRGIEKAENEIIAFPRCKSVHTFAVYIPIDVIVLDSTGRVIRSIRRLGPNKFIYCRRANSIWERRASAQPWPEKGEIITQEVPDDEKMPEMCDCSF